MLAFGLPSGGEWLIILIIALLIFGSRLPAVMRSLGKSVNEFKKGVQDIDDEVKSATESAEKPSETASTDSARTQSPQSVDVGAETEVDIDLSEKDREDA